MCTATTQTYKLRGALKALVVTCWHWCLYIPAHWTAGHNTHTHTAHTVKFRLINAPNDFLG